MSETVERIRSRQAAKEKNDERDRLAAKVTIAAVLIAMSRPKRKKWWQF